MGKMDRIRSRPLSEQGKENYDRIFGKPKEESPKGFDDGLIKKVVPVES
jgi:hypothetical protein